MLESDSAKLLTSNRTQHANQSINVCESLEMLRLGNAIRLTRKEVERLERITGLPVVGVRTLDDLRKYVADCKAYYAEDSREFEMLAWLIDNEVSRCLAAA
ncbi:MAG: hypothetical protein AB7K71_39000 [Polyangiaceae bacterium]